MTRYHRNRSSMATMMRLYQEILKPYQMEINVILNDLLEQNAHLGGTRKVVHRGKLYQPYQMMVNDSICNCHDSLQTGFDELDKKIRQLESSRDTLASYITTMVSKYPNKSPLYFLPKAVWSLFKEPPDDCLSDEKIPDEIHELIAHALLLRSIYEVN